MNWGVREIGRLNDARRVAAHRALGDVPALYESNARDPTSPTYRQKRAYPEARRSAPVTDLRSVLLASPAPKDYQATMLRQDWRPCYGCGSRGRRLATGGTLLLFSPNAAGAFSRLPVGDRMTEASLVLALRSFDVIASLPHGPYPRSSGCPPDNRRAAGPNQRGLASEFGAAASARARAPVA
jgi:hypothetical protein